MFQRLRSFYFQYTGDCSKTTIKPEDIAEISKEVKELVRAAKFGEWPIVWSIIGTPEKPKKSYLINCIPEDRRWSTLHQAVYFNNVGIVKQLIRHKECDPEVQTKSGASEGEGYETPSDIATLKKYDVITKLFTDLKSSVVKINPPPFASEEFGLQMRKDGPVLMMIAMANYKETFHPNHIASGTTFMSMIKSVFEHVDSGTNWMKARGKLKESFYSLDKDQRNRLLQSNTKKLFYESVLHIYTTESYNIYREANGCLRRQAVSTYTPSGFDLSLSPYIVLLQAIALFWPGLTKKSCSTYRCVGMNMAEVELYEPGTIITWPAFTSSSYDKDVARKFPVDMPSNLQRIMFEIDNTATCVWQPRLVEKLSEWEKEKEVMHPAGAMFKVVSKQLDPYVIKLELLS